MTESRGHIRIVEDDDAVREGLEALLKSWGYTTSLYPDAESLLKAKPDGRCTCILIDVRLPGMDGLALVAELRRRGLLTPILMMSAHGDISTAVEAMRLGAQDFIEKPFDDEPLIQRIEALKTLLAPIPQDPEARAVLLTLTPRETQVMQGVVAGQANKVIAHRLGISLKTVEMHRARVMKKTGTKTLAHLVRLALAAGYQVGEGA
ncbi:MAG: response regulator [Rhodobacteraceae bacterium]|nr:response regulator [Paracoccaceae bacterium]